MASHQQFHRDLRDGGHTPLHVSPLEPSAQATSMRPDGAGGALVTDGPFSETTEQVVGFYLIESDDEAGAALGPGSSQAGASTSSSGGWPSSGPTARDE